MSVVRWFKWHLARDHYSYGMDHDIHVCVCVLLYWIIPDHPPA